MKQAITKIKDINDGRILVIANRNISSALIMTNAIGLNKVIMPSIGFIFGGILITIMDKIFTKKYANNSDDIIKEIIICGRGFENCINMSN